MSKVDWAQVAHEVIDRINSMTPEEWKAMMEKHRYIPSEEDLRFERMNKLFACGAAVAIDKGYIEIEEICEALGAPCPPFDAETEEDEREAVRQIELIYNALDEYFEEIFGLKRSEVW